jgi:hypothetical protein
LSAVVFLNIPSVIAWVDEIHNITVMQNLIIFYGQPINLRMSHINKLIPSLCVVENAAEV